MKKNASILFCFLLVAPAFLPAQTAVLMEELLGTEALTYEQAARFVLEAADIPEMYGPLTISSPEAAFSFAAEQRWLPKNAESRASASLKGVSLLVMQSFEIKGGMFYSLFKNPHYAYRELVYRDIIQDRADPDMTVSGEKLLFMVHRVLSSPEYERQINWREAWTPAAVPARQPTPEEIRREAEYQALAQEINTQLAAREMADTEARVTEQGVTISLSNIQFLANSAELPEAEQRKLREIAQILEAIPTRRILVTGHTALAGTPEDQLRTSQDRAASVAAYLISLGVRNADEVYAQGFGATRPIADNSTPQGMALNRRVEITILEN